MCKITNYLNTFVHVTLVFDDTAPKGSNQPKHNHIIRSNIRSTCFKIHNKKVHHLMFSQTPTLQIIKHFSCRVQSNSSGGWGEDLPKTYQCTCPWQTIPHT